jgi:CheY-like chemotaxis protein
MASGQLSWGGAAEAEGSKGIARFPTSRTATRKGILGSRCLRTDGPDADTYVRAGIPARPEEPFMDATGKSERPSPSSPHHARSSKGPHSSSTSSPTVLVVDDEESVRESTAAILRFDGFNVLEAADGAAATWILASERVDVVLLDLQLGRLDGTAVLESLEESSTVVVFSAFGDMKEKELRREFGDVVFECLHKPVPPPLLIEVMEAASTHARSEGRETSVRPIAPRMALRLAMAGLAHLTPQTESDEDVVWESRSQGPDR